MASRAYKPGEIAARGESIYREQVLPQVGPVEKGTFVVIDVESGDYEVDARDATATRRLLKRRPEAVTYGVRVGYRAAYRHVGGFRMPQQRGLREGSAATNKRVFHKLGTCGGSRV